MSEDERSSEKTRRKEGSRTLVDDKRMSFLRFQKESIYMLIHPKEHKRKQESNKKIPTTGIFMTLKQISEP